MGFKHPFISNPRLVIYYFSIWAAIITAAVLVNWFAYNNDPVKALAEAISLLLTYSILGLSIWYVIKSGSVEKFNFIRILIYHFIAATILIFIWLYFATIIIKIIHPDAGKWLTDNLAANIFAGYILYLIYVMFFYAINYYQGFKEKLRNEGRLKALVKEAELHALKSQINPHFMFNSLNIISSLTMTDPAKAQEMVINLSDLMRYSLKHHQVDKVPLCEELQNSQLYLNIEKVRFGSKLKTDFKIEESCSDAVIPNMILQPIYENAIKHGVYEAIEPVTISTCCTRQNGMLKITISNNYDPSTITRKGEGIGLSNIRDRLQIIFGNPLLLNVETKNNQFKVTITIPQK